MPCGLLTPRQQAALRPFVEDKVVHDLGAGDGGYAKLLVENLDAFLVHAVEKEAFVRKPDSRIQYHHTYISKYDPPALGVAFLSWPVNWFIEGLVPLLKRAGTIVYLGKNTDQVSCGFPGLFEFFLTRKLLAYHPHHKNTLIVLGEPLQEPRLPRGEELAGLSMYNGGASLDFRTVERETTV